MGNVINVSTNKNEKEAAFKAEIARYQLPDGRWRVYIKPYTAEIKEDLEFQKNCVHNKKSMTITEENGTYCFTSNSIYPTFMDAKMTPWGMLFWRYRCESISTFATEIQGVNSQRICWKDNNVNMEFTADNMDKHFIVVSISPDFIAANTLPRFHKVA